MRKPKAEREGSSIGNERISNSSPLFQFLTAELLQKHTVCNSLDGKHQKLIQHITEGKAHGSGPIIDDVQRHIEDHLSNDIDNCQESQHLLLPVTKKQRDAQLQGDGKYDSGDQGYDLPCIIVALMSKNRVSVVVRQIYREVAVKSIPFIYGTDIESIRLGEIQQDFEGCGRIVGPVQLIIFRTVP